MHQASKASSVTPEHFYFIEKGVGEVKHDAGTLPVGPGSLVLYEPQDMRYVLAYYAPHIRSQSLRTPVTAATEGSPVFVLASFQKNRSFFNETNKVVGQLTFFRTLVRRFKTPQTMVWEFQ